MDANYIHAWEQGNVARALLAGHGFGSPFLSNQPSAIMPPVYPLIVAVFFHLFGIHTAQSIFAIHAFDSLINSLACIPVFLIARRSFGQRVALWAGWVWDFSQRHLFFRGVGLVNAPASSLPVLAVLSGAGHGTVRRGLVYGPVLACWRALLHSPSRRSGADSLSAWCWRAGDWRAGKRWLLPGMVGIARASGHHFALADPRRRGLSSLHSDARQHGAGDVVGQQRQRLCTGRTTICTRCTTRRNWPTITNRRTGLHGPQSAAGQGIYSRPSRLVRVDVRTARGLSLDRLLELLRPPIWPWSRPIRKTSRS